MSDDFSLTCPRCGDLNEEGDAKCVGCGANLMIDNPRTLSIGTDERAKYGVIITFERPGVCPLTIHSIGTVKAAIRRTCDMVASMHPDWKVVCISTPATIYADLPGRKNHSRQPEAMLLGLAGRKEMLHPRLKNVISDGM